MEKATVVSVTGKPLCVPNEIPATNLFKKLGKRDVSEVECGHFLSAPKPTLLQFAKGDHNVFGDVGHQGHDNRISKLLVCACVGNNDSEIVGIAHETSAFSGREPPGVFTRLFD